MVKHKFTITEATAEPPIDVLFDQIADSMPDAQADRRDGLRLDWPTWLGSLAIKQYRAGGAGDRRG